MVPSSSISHSRAAGAAMAKSNWLGRVGVALAGTTVFGIVAAILLKQTPADPHKHVIEVTVLRLPPPPPPPEQKPPEPPKEKEVVRVDTPKPEDKSPEQPAQGPLGVNAQGNGSGDSFGLVGRPGGRDITTIGGGGDGLTESLYGSGAARFLAQELARDPKLRHSVYKVELLVWIGKDGRIERGSIIKGSGDATIDQLISDGLSDVGPYRQPMPENLPQPLRIRVTSADA